MSKKTNFSFLFLLSLLISFSARAMPGEGPVAPDPMGDTSSTVGAPAVAVDPTLQAQRDTQMQAILADDTARQNLFDWFGDKDGTIDPTHFLGEHSVFNGMSAEDMQKLADKIKQDKSLTVPDFVQGERKVGVVGTAELSKTGSVAVDAKKTSGALTITNISTKQSAGGVIVPTDRKTTYFDWKQSFDSSAGASKKGLDYTTFKDRVNDIPDNVADALSAIDYIQKTLDPKTFNDPRIRTLLIKRLQEVVAENPKEFAQLKTDVAKRNLRDKKVSPLGVPISSENQRYYAKINLIARLLGISDWSLLTAWRDEKVVMVGKPKLSAKEEIGYKFTFDKWKENFDAKLSLGVITAEDFAQSLKTIPKDHVEAIKALSYLSTKLGRADYAKHLELIGRAFTRVLYSDSSEKLWDILNNIVKASDSKDEDPSLFDSLSNETQHTILQKIILANAEKYGQEIEKAKTLDELKALADILNIFTATINENTIASVKDKEIEFKNKIKAKAQEILIKEALAEKPEEDFEKRKIDFDDEKDSITSAEDDSKYESEEVFDDELFKNVEFAVEVIKFAKSVKALAENVNDPDKLENVKKQFAELKKYLEEQHEKLIAERNENIKTMGTDSQQTLDSDYKIRVVNALLEEMGTIIKKDTLSGKDVENLLVKVNANYDLFVKPDWSFESYAAKALSVCIKLISVLMKFVPLTDQGAWLQWRHEKIGTLVFKYGSPLDRFIDAEATPATDESVTESSIEPSLTEEQEVAGKAIEEAIKNMWKIFTPEKMLSDVKEIKNSKDWKNLTTNQKKLLDITIGQKFYDSFKTEEFKTMISNTTGLEGAKQLVRIVDFLYSIKAMSYIYDIREVGGTLKGVKILRPVSNLIGKQVKKIITDEAKNNGFVFDSKYLKSLNSDDRKAFESYFKLLKGQSR